MVPSEPPRYGVPSLRCAVTVYEESMWWWVLTISSLRSEIVIVSFVGVVPRRLPAAKEMRSVMCHECVGCRPCEVDCKRMPIHSHGRGPGAETDNGSGINPLLRSGYYDFHIFLHTLMRTWLVLYVRPFTSPTACVHRSGP